MRVPSRHTTAIRTLAALITPALSRVCAMLATQGLVSRVIRSTSALLTLTTATVVRLALTPQVPSSVHVAKATLVMEFRAPTATNAH